MNILVLLAIAAVAALLWFGRGRTLAARQWRLASGVGATALFVGGGYFAVRGQLLLGLALAVVGGLLAVSARAAPESRPAPRAPTSNMTDAEARSLLGVGADATREEVEAAYTRVMKRAHPDQGGTSGLAAKVNEARETLLGRRR